MSRNRGVKRRANSWGHQIAPWTEPPKRAAWHNPKRFCSKGKHCPGRTLVETGSIYGRDYYLGAPATHVATYNYVTGRAGRVSFTERFYCDPCAEKWRADHPIEPAPAQENA